MPGRKSLPHDVPLWIDPAREVFFITVCCERRGGAQLTKPEIAPRLRDAARFYHERGEWWARVFMLMPDHCHALLGVPMESEGLAHVLRRWKRWTATQLGIAWQRDFFEHRLRSDESIREKADYILRNPERAGLVARWEEWPWVWIADARGGDQGRLGEPSLPSGESRPDPW